MLKRLKRLERDLADLQTTEAKRRQQLKDARSRALVVRRELAALRAEIVVREQGPAPDAAPMGYCLREKRAVQIVHAEPVTLSNGRAALSGTCSTCGARVMVLSTRPITPAPIRDPKQTLGA